MHPQGEEEILLENLFGVHPIPDPGFRRLENEDLENEDPPVFWGQQGTCSNSWVIRSVCNGFSDVILQGNYWWCHKLLAVYSGY